MDDYKYKETFYRESGFLKNIFITHTQIMGSVTDFEDLKTFLSEQYTNNPETNHRFIKFDLVQITKLILFEEKNEIQIYYKVGNSDEETRIQFGKKQDYENVLELLKRKCTHLKPTTERIDSGYKTFKPNPYLITLGLLYSLNLIVTACQIENEWSIGMTKKRNLLTIIFSFQAKILGFYGSIAFATLISGICIYFLVKAYYNSKIRRTVYRL
ncbi:MAG: hypothetical protein ACK5MK_11600 [Dysgonomonas sp.]